MSNQTSELELASLRKQQSKARHGEVFGALSPAERRAYDRRQNRIQELELDQFEQRKQRALVCTQTLS